MGSRRDVNNAKSKNQSVAGFVIGFDKKPARAIAARRRAADGLRRLPRPARLGDFKRFLAKKRPAQPAHFACNGHTTRLRYPNF